jgi:hypothetical protein
LFDREQSLAERADGHQGVSAGEILASAMRADVAQDREDDKRRAEHSAAMDDYRANLLLSQQGRLRSLAEILQAAAVISGQEFYGSAAAPSDPVSRARSARREHRESIDRQAAEEAVRNVWRALNVVDGQPGIEGWARRAGEGIGLQVRGTSP